MDNTVLTAPTETLIHSITSIVDRLDLAGLFPRVQPLEVELGSGDGSFLVNYARLHPEINFLGVERLLGRLRKLDRKARRAGLVNLRGLRIEARGYPTPTEICLRLAARGCRIGEQGVTHRERTAGASKLHPWRTAWGFLRFLFYLRRKLQLHRAGIIIEA